MPNKAALDLPWARVSELVARTIGLHFPPERRMDLQRGVSAAAQEFGFADPAACVEWLLTAPLSRSQLQVLARHLTIGETYFFREKNTFEALRAQVLPQLIERRRRERRLRLWSAACCTGEEAYSLAILLRQCLPDLHDWRLSILATDINDRFLQKAAAGIYGEWSFRDAPAGFKERYFVRTEDGRYAILSDIRQCVQFAPLNLVEDSFPSFANDTNAMDLVLCRNVLMYFTPAQARKVVDNLRRTLREDGWLAVSPSEASHTLFAGFAARNFPGAILYRKCSEQKPAAANEFDARNEFEFAAPHATAHTSPSSATERTAAQLALPNGELADAQDSPTPYARAVRWYEQGRYAEAASVLLESLDAAAADVSALSLLTRAFANQDRLDEAHAWCQRWIAADRLDSAARYLSAVIQEELGRPEQARRSLQQALYLEPGFVLAHFALGNLARGNGSMQEANKHFANTLLLLRRHAPDDLLPESDGLTAGRLQEIVVSLMRFEVTS